MLRSARTAALVCLFAVTAAGRKVRVGADLSASA